MGRVAIIGGGPAGLACGQALAAAGIDFTLFESGAPLAEREHDRAEQLGIGIGGAGLFSDGKFSFYPSGTALYRLEPARLERAYNRVTRLLRDAGIACPVFPRAEAVPGGSGFQRKDYPSSYGTLAQRIRLTDSLAAFSDFGRVRSYSQILGIDRARGGYALTIADGPSGKPRREIFDKLVLATGRFGGINLAALADGAFELTELRYELGIRIEHRNEVGFMKATKTPDVKFLLRERGVEVRTFCTCRRGEVWMIPYDDRSALSGRSDGPPTGYSNFGLLPRFAGESAAEGRAIWQDLHEANLDPQVALWQPLREFMGRVAVSASPAADRPWHPRDLFVRGDIAATLPPALCDLLRGSIQALVDRYPDMDSPDTMCLFPAIEGVGLYPRTDADMRLPGENIWCCGDLVGHFRGLVPALVSGYFAGAAVAETSPEPVRLAASEPAAA